jgi:alpha-glucosidase (family GH31 glycosyl hydrolase)
MAGFTVNTGGALSSILDYYFFSGTPKTILDRYTSISGRPQLPPKWAFGLWMSANEWNTQAEVTNELNNASTYTIPATVLVLEQWSDEATFYIWHGAQYTAKPGSQAHSYSEFSFPPGGAWTNPQAMVADAHSRGIKVVLWQIPVFKENFDTNPPAPPQQHLNDKSYAVSQGYVVAPLRRLAPVAHD